MTLTKVSSTIILYHLRHLLNDQQELVNYLNFLSIEQAHYATIQQFRDQIMQMHARIKDLMYKFVEFLDNNSLYS